MSVINELDHRHDSPFIPISEYERRHDAAQQALVRYRLHQGQGKSALGRHSVTRSRNYKCVAELSRFDVWLFAFQLVVIGITIGMFVGFEMATETAARLAQ